MSRQTLFFQRVVYAGNDALARVADGAVEVEYQGRYFHNQILTETTRLQ